jgi:hypothetical protein
MRKLLRSLRSSVSSRQQRQEAQQAQSAEEGSSSGELRDYEKQTTDLEKKQQDEIGDSSTHHGQSHETDDGDVVVDLPDVTRICKRDNKKERREKYKMCFERNNVHMVSLCEKK